MILETKIQFYKALVRTVLCYTLEVRELSKVQLMRLKTIQVRHLRRMIRSPAHVTHESNEAVREKTGVHSIDSYLMAMRIKFWKSQTTLKNKALWIANWGKLSQQGGRKSNCRGPITALGSKRMGHR